MDPIKNTKIIKDLLYEQSSREFLTSIHKKQRKTIFLYRVAAAMITVLLLALVGTKMLNFENPDKEILAQKLYTFPQVTKSRGANINFTDQYIDALNNKEYATVLEKLNVDSLSEQDLYIKAHLYYTLDSLDLAIQLINQSTFHDPYLQEEINWLTFLIKYRTNDKKSELRPYFKKLTDSYKEKAKVLMD